MVRRPLSAGRARPNQRRRAHRPSSPLRRRLTATLVVAVAAGLVVAAILGVLTLSRQDTRQRLAQNSLIRISHLADAVRFHPAAFLFGEPMTPSDVRDNAALRTRLTAEGDTLERLAPSLGRPIDAAIDTLNQSVIAEIDLITQNRLDEAQRLDRGAVTDAYQRLGSDAPNSPTVATTTGLLVPAETLMSARAGRTEHNVARYIVIIVGGVGTLLIGLMLAFASSRRRWAALDLEQAAELAAADRLRALIRNSSDLTLVFDADGVFRYVSPASLAIIGRTDSELIDTSLADLLHPDDRAAVSARLRDVSSGDGAPRALHFRMRHGDGSYRLMEAALTDLQHLPAVGGIVANLRDVTDRTRLEVELRHAQKLESVGQLASGMAHEINTPIQFVGDNVRFLGDAFDDLIRSAEHPAETIDVEFLAAEVPQAIAQTLEGVDRVAAIVRAMKAFGHPGADEKSPTNLNLAVENTLIVAGNTIKDVADVVVELGELPPVWCHPGDINQVLVNLVVNAAHAIAEKAERGAGRGTITVRTYLDNAAAVVEISDTGSGIPAEIAGRIFEPFFTTKEVGRGTGQGLALAYALVTDRHSGSITFTSQQGVGTTFTVRLPVRGRSEPDAGGIDGVDSVDHAEELVR